MSEIKVDKIKGLQVGASGPDITFDANGNITYTGTWTTTGDYDANNVDISGALIIPRYTTAARPTSPVAGSIIFDTDEEGMFIYNGEDWVAGGGGSATTALGGTVSTSGLYTIHTFTGTADLIVDGSSDLTVDILLVGGGGSGGTRNAGPDTGGTDGGSGGGAGGWVQVSGVNLAPGNYPAQIGGGGAERANPGQQQHGISGTNTNFNGLVAYGGGWGASGPGNRPGGPGGSGGGAGGGGGSPGSGGGATQPGAPGLSGSSGYGTNGGPNPNQAPYTGSGGGGAGSAGNQGGNSRQAPGGNGRASSITGSSITYAGGGGGGGGFPSPTRGGNGGPGGGGHGGSSPNRTSTGRGENADANRGGGGGGGAGSSWPSGASGAGGSGVVIVRYPTP